MSLPPNVSNAIGDYQAVTNRLKSALRGEGGNKRLVTIPHEPTKKDSRESFDIPVFFERELFNKEKLDDGKIGEKIKIPDGITVTVGTYDFQLTTNGRSQPIKVNLADGLKVSVQDGYVIIEAADLSEKNEPVWLEMGAQMNLGLSMSNLMAGFTYLQGVADPKDSGVSSANAPCMRGLHRIISPEIN